MPKPNRDMGYRAMSPATENFHAPGRLKISR